MNANTIKSIFPGTVEVVKDKANKKVFTVYCTSPSFDRFQDKIKSVTSSEGLFTVLEFMQEDKAYKLLIK